jgi:hypothetical protein
MESIAHMSMTCSARLRPAISVWTDGFAQIELMRTSETTGLLAVHTAGSGVAYQGTGVSTLASTSARKASALLPIIDVVVFDGAAGIRSWDPPV